MRAGVPRGVCGIQWYIAQWNSPTLGKIKEFLQFLRRIFQNLLILNDLFYINYERFESFDISNCVQFLYTITRFILNGMYIYIYLYIFSLVIKPLFLYRLLVDARIFVVCYVTYDVTLQVIYLGGG